MTEKQQTWMSGCGGQGWREQWEDSTWFGRENERKDV